VPLVKMLSIDKINKNALFLINIQ